MIEYSQLRFDRESEETDGLMTTQRGTWNGRPVSIKSFRFQVGRSAGAASRRCRTVRVIAER